MKSVLCLIPVFLCLALAAPAQPDPAQGQDKALLERLERLEQEIQTITRLLRDRIDIAALRAAFRSRSMEFRVVTPPDAPSLPPGDVSPKPVEPRPGVAPAGDVEGEETPPAPPAVQPGADADQAPMPVLIKADGIPIQRSEVEALAAYLASFNPDLPPGETRTRALEALILRAHVEAKYKDRLPAMKERIQKIRARIVDGGEIFADVAAKESDCPSKEQGGDLGEFGRTGMVEPFGMVAFSTPKGEVSEPFLTPFGYHIIRVIRAPMGPEAATARVRARHILVLFDSDSNRLRELIGEARQGKVLIEIVDPAAASLVPPQFSRR